MALEAAGLAAKERQAPLGRGAQGLPVAGQVAVERTVARDQGAFKGGHRLRDAVPGEGLPREDRGEEFLIFRVLPDALGGHFRVEVHFEVVAQREGGLLLETAGARVVEHPPLPGDVEQGRRLAPQFTFLEAPGPRESVGIEQLGAVASTTASSLGPREPGVEKQLLAEGDLLGRGRIVSRIWRRTRQRRQGLGGRAPRRGRQCRKQDQSCDSPHGVSILLWDPTKRKRYYPQARRSSVRHRATDGQRQNVLKVSYSVAFCTRDIRPTSLIPV